MVAIKSRYEWQKKLKIISKSLLQKNTVDNFLSYVLSEAETTALSYGIIIHQMVKQL